MTFQPKLLNENKIVVFKYNFILHLLCHTDFACKPTSCPTMSPYNENPDCLHFHIHAFQIQLYKGVGILDLPLEQA